MADFTEKLQPLEPSGPNILTHERARSNVNVDQLAHHLLSRGDFLTRQKRIVTELQRHVVFTKKNQLNLARPDRYYLGLARAKKLRRLVLERGWDSEDYRIAEYLVDEMSPYHLQNAMFATTIREQASDDQKAYWLPKIENWDVIGCYGQTELGHGSNVKGIETEARWDPKAKHFVLHSPTLTASKWWNGSLGRTANHAIVVAQLMLPDLESGQLRSFGPHQFIVQIRDMKTHLPLDGIAIGDIGPKYGYTSMDNGYMLFDNHVVPYTSLLSKYSGIDSENGTYIKPDNPATVYGSMTYVRAQIIMHARLVLARAVTIAVRYTSIRRQFADRDVKTTKKAPEEAVLNYPTVGIRILPLLATTFALHYTGEIMYQLYYATRESIEKSGDFSRLAEMHATSSGLKSLCTMLAADGIETCRRAMGGHGFGGGSGIIPLNNDYLSKPTVEGDNWMITQQTASYLINRMTHVVNNPSQRPVDAVDAQYANFLQNKSKKVDLEFDVLNMDVDLVKAFQHRAAFMAHQVYQARVVEKQGWTTLMIHLHALSRAHSECLLVTNFHTAIFDQDQPPSPAIDSATINVLKILFRLFALSTLNASSSDFLLSGALTMDQLPQLMPEIQKLMADVRPHAVRLVDAWSIPDYLLESSLGRSDGDVYHDLFRRAHKENPLNAVTFNPNWRDDEIIMGEGSDAARRRIDELALGSLGQEKHTRAKL